GGDLLALVDDLVGCARQGRTADRQRARTVGAHAHRHERRVAVDDLDILDRHAELVGDELGEGGLMPLSVAVRAGIDEDAAGRIEADLARFPQAYAGTERANHGGRRDAAGLDIGTETDAAQLALASGF